jgi:hypothetical protein
MLSARGPYLARSPHNGRARPSLLTAPQVARTVAVPIIGNGDILTHYEVG